MTIKTKVACIYHDSCLDGIASAWVVWKHFQKKREDITLIPARYGQPLPEDLEGKIVYIVDFSYKRTQIEYLMEHCEELVVLDHHNTAKRELAGLFEVDENYSGAMLTWRHFNPGMFPPPAISFVQDRDLWQFKLENTRAWTTAAFSYPMLVEIFDELVNRGVQGVVREGEALLRKHNQDIARILENVRTMKILGVEVPVVNANVMYASDIGAIISQNFPFAAVYSDGENKRYYSLRSQKLYGAKVNVIAELFGGGGHPNAAGFSISYDDPRFGKSHKELDLTRKDKFKIWLKSFL